MSLLRGLWAPIILFYLGGPDTMTVLRSEENQMWLRHIIGLFTQGLRTSYILILTWTSTLRFSLLALLMLFPGLIKYGVNALSWTYQVWRETVGNQVNIQEKVCGSCSN
ncbi:hypothetical protein CsSME_00012056 [Camellia sinensis var. sinensis]